jgi:geranylgeranyl pyrophosphate synthase
MAHSLPDVFSENASLTTLDRLASLEHLEGAMAQARALVPPEVWRRALLAPARGFVARPSKHFRGRLVRLGWSLGGGPEDGCPSDLSGLIELIHSGSLIVDDIQDNANERRGEAALHRSHGVPMALNVGNWLYFAALHALSWVELPRHKIDAMRQEAISALLRCHHGQALDLSVQVHELKQDELAGTVSTCTELKTGTLMGLAARVGARAATDDEVVVAAIGRFGERLGVGLQMLDDLGCVVGNSRRHKAIEDLESGAPTWVWSLVSERCDELTFARLQRDARRVSQGGGDAEGLLIQLRERVHHVGMARVNTWLTTAFNELQETVDDHPALEQVHSELERLKCSYH